MTQARVALSLVGAAMVAGWVDAEAHSRTFTRQAEVVTGAAIVVFCVIAARRVAHEPTRPFDLRAVMIWACAALGVITVELVNLFNGPRYQFPTISSLTNQLFGETPIGRALLAVAWLSLGAWLVLCGS